MSFLPAHIRILQKPKKKKPESTPAEITGTEAKPKKTKSKKSGDLSSESSPLTQSTTDGSCPDVTSLHFCQSVYTTLTHLPHRWREAEEEETGEGEGSQEESQECPKEEEEWVLFYSHLYISVRLVLFILYYKSDFIFMFSF